MTFKGHSRSLEMSRFDTAHIISYYPSKLTGPILYRFPHIAIDWSKIPKLYTISVFNAHIIIIKITKIITEVTKEKNKQTKHEKQT